MPFAPVNGAELYYEAHGEGPALVFAHGGFGNHLSWWQQVADFARSFKCIVFDHRGFGWSREPSDSPGPFAFAEDLRALLDHLGIERAAVVGQSMGGWTVLGFAGICPQRTRALVLCDTMAGVDAPEMRLSAPAARERPADPAAVFRQGLAPDFFESAPAMDFLYRQIAALNVNLTPGALRKLLDVKNRVEPVVEHRIPTLIFAGEMDQMTPPSIMEALARQIPHARLAKVAGAGHSVYWEKPAELNAILKEFLSSIPA